MIDNGFLLSPGELYCLGGVLNAKYIDYAYIAAMDDIGQNYEAFRQDALASLTDKEILVQDFSGEAVPNGECLQVFDPIFFGTVETSLTVCNIGDEVTVDVYNFHFYDDCITMVKNQDGGLCIAALSEDDLKDIVTSLLDESYTTESGVVIKKYDREKVTRFLSAKSIDVGKKSVVQTYIEHDGVFYTETGSGSLSSLSAEDFVLSILNVIKGAM